MSASAPVLSSDARKQLLYAVRRVLRPIVRLLIRVGISFDEFADVARGAFVESAIRDRLGGIAPTREGIAFATGLPRQQVDYYIDNERAVPAVGQTLARAATEVMHRWYTDPHYLGPYGIPIELEFETPTSRSFRSLVTEVDPKVSAGHVLEELLRAGSVAHSGEKHFRALTRWFIAPEALSPHWIEYFGDTLTHLARTLEYNFNLTDAESKRLERFVFADRGLPSDLLPNFEAHARDRTNQFLMEIDDWFAHRSSESDQSSQLVEAGVNVFLYAEPPPDPRTLSALVQLSRSGRRAMP